MCPSIKLHVKKNIQIGSRLVCHSCTSNVYEVWQGSVSFTVDLEAKTCSCGEWERFSIPCCHACCSINRVHKCIYDFCDPYYRADFYKIAYKEAVYPIVNLESPKCEVDDLIVLPPKTKIPPGRPRSKRIRSIFEAPQQKCGRCSQYARHNRRTCKASIWY